MQVSTLWCNFAVLNPYKMINAYVPKPSEPEQETPQWEAIPDQRLQNMLDAKFFEIIKRHQITIQPLDRGCMVSFAYKSVGFDDVDTAMRIVREYFDKPAKVLTELGFDKELM